MCPTPGASTAPHSVFMIIFGLLIAFTASVAAADFTKVHTDGNSTIIVSSFSSLASISGYSQTKKVAYLRVSTGGATVPCSRVHTFTAVALPSSDNEVLKERIVGHGRVLESFTDPTLDGGAEYYAIGDVTSLDSEALPASDEHDRPLFYIALVCNSVPVGASVALDAAPSSFQRMRIAGNTIATAFPAENLSLSGRGNGPNPQDCSRFSATVSSMSSRTDDVSALTVAVNDALHWIVSPMSDNETFLAIGADSEVDGNADENHLVVHACARPASAGDVGGSDEAAAIETERRKQLLWAIFFAPDHSMLEQTLSVSASDGLNTHVVLANSAVSLTASRTRFDFMCKNPGAPWPGRDNCGYATCSEELATPIKCTFGRTTVPDVECLRRGLESPLPELKYNCFFTSLVTPAPAPAPAQTFFVTWEDSNGFFAKYYKNLTVFVFNEATYERVRVTIATLDVIPSTEEGRKVFFDPVALNFLASNARIGLIADPIDPETTEGDSEVSWTDGFEILPACDFDKCDVHGTCNADSGACVCEGEWTGRQCEIPPCQTKGCSAHSTCEFADEAETTSKCVCNVTDGFPTHSGPLCETEEVRCAVSSPCANDGERSESVTAEGTIACGECTCTNHWNATTDCSECGLDCGDHGSANSDCSACVCDTEWSGEKCDIDPCATKGCSAEGTEACTLDFSTGAAVCGCKLDEDNMPRFSGSKCETPEQRCSVKASPCANGGNRREFINPEGRIECEECACKASWDSATDCMTCGRVCENKGLVSSTCDSCQCSEAYHSDHCECRHVVMTFVVLAETVRTFVPTPVDPNPEPGAFVVDIDEPGKALVYATELGRNIDSAAAIRFRSDAISVAHNTSPKGVEYYTLTIHAAPMCISYASENPGSPELKLHGSKGGPLARMLASTRKVATASKGELLHGVAGLSLTRGSFRQYFSPFAPVYDEDMETGYSTIVALKTFLNTHATSESLSAYPALAAVHLESGFGAKDINCQLPGDRCPSNWGRGGVFKDQTTSGGSEGGGETGETGGDGSSKLPTGAIVGIAVGGSILLFIIIGVSVAAAKGALCFAKSQASSAPAAEMTSV